VLTAATFWLDSLRQGLRDLGYVEGQNIFIEVRSSEGQDAPLPEFALELVRRPVEILVVAGIPATSAAIAATTDIPIVTVAGGPDPLRAGYVSSLAHPGGNVTGLTDFGERLTAKRLELLHDALPGVQRVGVFRNPATTEGQWQEAVGAAPQLKVELRSIEVQGPDDFRGAFAIAAEQQVGALLLLLDALTILYQVEFGRLALERHQPAIHSLKGFVSAGGLLAYGPSIPDLAQRAATYVDKILKGAKPADLPIEQPTIFDFVVNLKTAQALDLTIPQHVLLQATEVIQ
jgi:putative ABC transport system substrate-binding protein